MIEVQLEGCVYELNFGYNAKTVVYTNSSSDIPKLTEIAGYECWRMKSYGEV
ncbi:MAG: hypothetical protein N2V75_00960 [Methanophagales archaeon]|nr:hypothetical protein [Methanophagales archaeon]